MKKAFHQIHDKFFKNSFLPDEESAEHGLAALLEMLFKYHRCKNFYQ